MPTPYLTGLLAGAIQEKENRLAALERERRTLIVEIAEMEAERGPLHYTPGELAERNTFEAHLERAREAMKASVESVEALHRHPDYDPATHGGIAFELINDSKEN